MKVYFQNFGCSLLKGKIKNIFLEALNVTNVGFEGFSVTLRFVSPEEIKNLNNTFREIEKVTDVLSFPNLNYVKAKGVPNDILTKNISTDDGLVPLGDIAICKAVAREQAKEYGHSFKREVCFLALHGFLHLLGYDHLTPEDNEEMQELTNQILKKQRVERNV